MKIPKISCIIPAYNEGPRIGKVLEAVCDNDLIDEAIIVDDASTDDTVCEIRRFPEVKLIQHKINLGKSASVYSGLKLAKGDIVLFLDADLIGLRSDDITKLLSPVVSGNFDISISLRLKSTWWLFRFLGFDFLSGERAFRKNLFGDDFDKISKLKGFGLEVFMNRLIIKRKCKIKIISWKNVVSLYPNKKRGFFRGSLDYIGMIRDILKTVSPIEAVMQCAKMKHLIER